MGSPSILPEVRHFYDVLRRKHEEPFRREANVLVVYDSDVFYHLGNASQ